MAVLADLERKNFIYLGKLLNTKPPSKLFFWITLGLYTSQYGIILAFVFGSATGEPNHLKRKLKLLILQVGQANYFLYRSK